MPIVPAHVKIKGSARKKSSEISACKDIQDHEVKDLTKSFASTSLEKEGHESDGPLEKAFIEEKREESKNVGVGYSPVGESASSSTVFAALNAHANIQNNKIIADDQNLVAPSPTDASSTKPNSQSASIQKLTSKRTLLYPMQGVQAIENNDGMAPAEKSGDKQGCETKSVNFDLLQQRNVSLAKGLVADEGLNSAMGSVMMEVIQENRLESTRNLDEAVRTYKQKDKQKGGTGKQGHERSEPKGRSGGGGGASVHVNGGASANLKSFLNIAPVGVPNTSSTDASSEDLSFNGGMNILDMLRNARKTVKNGDNSSHAINWQQENLLKQQRQQQQQHQHQQVSEKNRNASSQSYAVKQQQQVKAFLKSTDGGKDVNYASSAVFNSPDVSEVPMPDFTGDMQGATFAKGGFFDSTA